MTNDSTANEAAPSRHPRSVRRDSLLSTDARSRRSDCRRCTQRALPSISLCEECYSRIADDLCTSQVLERLSK